MAKPSEAVAEAIAGKRLPVGAVTIAYVLFGLAPLTYFLNATILYVAPLAGALGIAGIVVAYAVRKRAAGSWVESHVRWLIRTFWWWLVCVAVAFAFAITMNDVAKSFYTAVAIWTVALLFVFYRVVHGLLRFHRRLPTPG